ncbi:hypothetical protein A374_07201 [Fictibacillus macauensis ZFHKF-1]|uniref:Uncharacterized protein n=1 Tax=Fictibacillus macauensis ZFHKF-1 TaxID=1196324 RepID=I8UH05_9BACL|nr:hypothetical protein [Fictibacillus macauensis]EIT86088.1 hypothetical protein A374_07201 [Fictibacillus macauensis ZFHKF-1]
MFTRIDVPFKIRAMGYAFYFPILPLLAFMYYWLNGESEFSFQLLKQMEFLIAPFSVWWIAFLFYDYYEEKGDELLFSYPLKAREHGLLTLVVFGGFYLALILLCSILLSLRISNSNMLLLFLQFGSQTVLYIGIAFSLVIISKKVMIPLLFVGVYVSTEFLTEGSILPFHIMLFNQQSLAFNEIKINVLGNLLFGSVLLTMGHLILKRKL